MESPSILSRRDEHGRAPQWCHMILYYALCHVFPAIGSKTGHLLVITSYPSYFPLEGIRFSRDERSNP
jgi:hypothetical protein